MGVFRGREGQRRVASRTMGVFRVVRRTEEIGFKVNGRVQSGEKDRGEWPQGQWACSEGEKDRGDWLQGQWACSEW